MDNPIFAIATDSSLTFSLRKGPPSFPYVRTNPPYVTTVWTRWDRTLKDLQTGVRYEVTNDNGEYWIRKEPQG